jgi:hypothetical protein
VGARSWKAKRTWQPEASNPTDRADALIGAIMLGPGADPHVLNPRAHQALLEIMQEIAIRNEEDPWRVDWIQL